MHPRPSNPLLALSWKEVLVFLVEYLNTGNEGTLKLWWVLTALRGPDSGDIYAKVATTAVIRYAIGLVNGVGNTATVRKDAQPSDTIRALMDRGDGDDGHFLVHVREAFDALGLNWFTLNEQTKTLKEKVNGILTARQKIEPRKKLSRQ